MYKALGIKPMASHYISNIYNIPSDVQIRTYFREFNLSIQFFQLPK